MAYYIVVCAFVFISFLTKNEAANILCLFQSPILSHQIAFRSITQELLRRGHQVDIVTTDPAYPKDQTPPNMTEFDIHEVSYNIWTKMFTNDKTNKGDLSNQVKKSLNLMTDILMSQLDSDELQSLIKSKKVYDLILAEATFPPAVIFSHLHKVPFVKISSLGATPIAFDYMGIPRHVMYYPQTLRSRAYNISGLEVYSEIYNDLVTYNRFLANEIIIHEKVIAEYIPDLPTFDELKSNVDMLLVNMNPVWEGIRPYSPNYIVTHMFAQKVKQVIPEVLQAYLDSSKNGVIYASFGTSVLFSVLPEHTISAILRAFSQLPYDVLLKCDKDELPGRPENVKLFKWLPQADVLKHTNIKLFITQGGQHSIDEAIEAGVPMVVIPNVFDQFANSERCVQHGIGVKLDLKGVTDQIILDAIKTVVDNERYRKNVAKLRSILQDNPMNGMDRLMWAIEYVIRHGGAKHMRSPSANLSWSEFFELELLFYCLTVIFITLLMILKLLLGVKILFVKVTKGSRNLDLKLD